MYRFLAVDWRQFRLRFSIYKEVTTLILCGPLNISKFLTVGKAVRRCSSLCKTCGFTCTKSKLHCRSNADEGQHSLVETSSTKLCWSQWFETELLYYYYYYLLRILRAVYIRNDCWHFVWQRAQTATLQAGVDSLTLQVC